MIQAAPAAAVAARASPHPAAARPVLHVRHRAVVHHGPTVASLVWPAVASRSRRLLLKEGRREVAGEPSLRIVRESARELPPEAAASEHAAVRALRAGTRAGHAAVRAL